MINHLASWGADETAYAAALTAHSRPSIAGGKDSPWVRHGATEYSHTSCPALRINRLNPDPMGTVTWGWRPLLAAGGWRGAHASRTEALEAGMLAMAYETRKAAP